MIEELSITYSVTPELRVKLKQPFGLLIRGTSSETMQALKAVVTREKPPVVIAVGDTVSRNIHERGIPAQLLITDGKCKRRTVQPRAFPDRSVVRVSNPPGMISSEAIVAVREALDGAEQVHIVVDGEEDLLTIVAVLYAPEGALVVYGQPGDGIVVVKVTAEKRAEAERILKAMEIVRKLNKKVNV